MPSQGFSDSSWPTSHVCNGPVRFAFGFSESREKRPKLIEREIGGVEPIEARSSSEPPRDEAIPLEAAKGPLYARKRGLENAGQLARVALVEELQRDEDAGPRPSAKGRGDSDHHHLSYDHICRSISTVPFLVQKLVVVVVEEIDLVARREAV